MNILSILSKGSFYIWSYVSHILGIILRHLYFSETCFIDSEIHWISCVLSYNCINYSTSMGISVYATCMAPCCFACVFSLNTGSNGSSLRTWATQNILSCAARCQWWMHDEHEFMMNMNSCLGEKMFISWYSLDQRTIFAFSLRSPNVIDFFIAIFESIIKVCKKKSRREDRILDVLVWDELMRCWATRTQWIFMHKQSFQNVPIQNPELLGGFRFF